MDLLLMVLESQFCTLSHLINPQIIKYLKNQGSNFLKE